MAIVRETDLRRRSRPTRSSPFLVDAGDKGSCLLLVLSVPSRELYKDRGEKDEVALALIATKIHQKKGERWLLALLRLGLGKEERRLSLLQIEFWLGFQISSLGFCVLTYI